MYALRRVLFVDRAASRGGATIVVDIGVDDEGLLRLQGTFDSLGPCGG